MDGAEAHLCCNDVPAAATLTASMFDEINSEGGKGGQ